MATLDWLILALYALLMLGVGLHFSSRNRTATDYVLGGRRMSPVAVGLSLFATLVSTLSYLANPGEMIAHGPMMATQSLAHPLIYLIVGYCLIPRIMNQPVHSAYELLEQRLGRGIRSAGALVFLLLRCGWLATILFATSRVVLLPLFNLDTDDSTATVRTATLCTLLGFTAGAYSSLGGIRGVVITDAIQSVTMLGGAVLTLAVITHRMGSVAAWWPDTWPDHWQAPSWGFDLSKRVSFGILLLSTTLWYVCTNGSDQMSIQRFLATRNAAAARRTLLVSQIADVSVSLLLGITGIALLGFYSAHQSLVPPGQSFSATGDRFFPQFIMQEMPAGLAGLLVAALLSAALSSLSSGLNSAAAVLNRDFPKIGEFLRPGESPAIAVTRLQILTGLVAVTAVLLSMLNLLFVGNLLERCFKIINLLTAPLFVLFFLALFIRFANAAGAWCGLITAILTAVFIAYGRELGVPENWQLSFTWMMPASLLTGITTGTAISFAASTAEDSNPQAHHPDERNSL
ncbi:MAG: sodium:solute symporter family transporter [Planctomycetota bacterium]